MLALIDESGTLPDPTDSIVVIAIVVADVIEPGLRRLLAKIRRQLPIKGKRRRERRVEELKFRTTSPKTRRQVLAALARQPVTLFVLIVIKDGVSVEDTPENYASLVNAILPECISWFPNLKRILFDRHFSRQTDQTKLSDFVLAKLEAEIVIEHVDSLQDARIDLADFVAGAVVYARLHGDTTYEDLIRSKIGVYKVVRWVDKEKW